ncbi:MAG: sarcosine oxidase subunit gamma [Alphaproteobacteria bacterium]|nr:sarcosine oxidase subunit gamma [Alphaproteobacteria bacterium]
MAEFNLRAEPFLGGFSHDYGGAMVEEVTDLSLISIAQPLNGRAALAKAVQSGLGCTLPAPGSSAVAENGDLRLLCLGMDSFLVINSGGMSYDRLAAKLDGAGYTTDQSDNWVALELSGTLAYAILERLCPIDLHPDVFPIGAFARTSIEHLNSIVLRQREDRFLLLCASSSATSFLHALTGSAVLIGLK